MTCFMNGVMGAIMALVVIAVLTCAALAIHDAGYAQAERCAHGSTRECR